MSDLPELFTRSVKHNGWLADLGPAPVQKRARRRPALALRVDPAKPPLAVKGAQEQLRTHLHRFFRSAVGDIVGQLERRLRPLRKLRKAEGDEALDTDASEGVPEQRQAIINDALRQIEFQGWSVLVNPTADILKAVALAGGREALIQLAVQAGVQGGPDAEAAGDIFDRLNTGAIAFAEHRAGELVGMRVLEDGTVVENPNPEWAITEATRNMIRDDVTRAFTEGMTRADLGDLLQENYAFSEARADMIARTEISKALVEGNTAAWKESGQVASTVWLLSDDHSPEVCPTGICDDNAAAGEVPLGEEFPSGDEAPPAHPNCSCSTAPVLGGEEGEEE